MRIVRLESENVKCLRAVTINPDGSLVILGGANGSGKSSVLDSIEMALAGATSIPSVPIRRGQDKASVKLDLGELIVERTFGNGDSKLTVKSKDGAAYPSPQKILDGLCSHIAFDPLEFSRLKPRDQAEQLRTLVGIDFANLDAERKRAYDERTAVNRQATTAKAQLLAMPAHEDAPAEAVSVKALADELERREAHQRKIEETERSAADFERAADAAHQHIETLNRRLLEIQAAFPVPGLGFDDAGVTYNGLPFDQASSAERLRVSAAMGMARRPKLRVMLIRDASLLDETGWALLAEMAEECEFQIWLETCQPGAPASVVIVDGEALTPEEAKEREAAHV